MAEVLIVEDADIQSVLIEKFLRGAHTVVGRANTAPGAVRKAATESPDVVVMDLRLDDGSGIEATREIKALDPTIAIVVSTANVGEDTRERALEAGGDAFLTKPYGRQDLLDAIERIL